MFVLSGKALAPSAVAMSPQRAAHLGPLPPRSGGMGSVILRSHQSREKTTAIHRLSESACPQGLRGFRSPVPHLHGDQAALPGDSANVGQPRHQQRAWPAGFGGKWSGAPAPRRRKPSSLPAFCRQVPVWPPEGHLRELLAFEAALCFVGPLSASGKPSWLCPRGGL